MLTNREELMVKGLGCNMGALIIALGFWGILYYNPIRTKNPQKSIRNYSSPRIRVLPGLWVCRDP